jgi:hypothetical protein
MLNALEANTIARANAAARKILEELKPVLDGLNVIYDTETTGAKVTITQQNLDADPALSGITKGQLDDGMYVLTATLRAAIAAGYTQLAQLAARA